MSVVLPINDDPRFRDITATAGQTELAIGFPFQDARDIRVFRRVGTVWSELATPADYIITGAGSPSGGSAILATAAAAGGRFLVLGDAVLDRLTSITRNGKFASKATDDELDRSRIIAQEQARDIGRALKVEFGDAGLTLNAGLADGDTLMKQGNRLVKGANAADIAGAQAYAASALASKEAAAASAAAAATFNPANYYAKTVLDPMLLAKANQSTTYTKTEVDSIVSPMLRTDAQALSNGQKAQVVSNLSLPFSKAYESAEQVITLGGPLTLAHGLGVSPKIVLPFLICKSSDAGFSAGDIIACPLSTSSNTADTYGLSYEMSGATNILVRFALGGFLCARKDSGVITTLTSVNWKLILRAFA